MKEFLKAFKEGLVKIAKSISEDKMDDAVDGIESLSKTLEETADDLKKTTEEEPGDSEPSDDDPKDGEDGDDAEPSSDQEEVAKTIEKTVKTELKKFADMYISASDAKQLFQELLEAMKSLAEVTKTTKEQVESVEEKVQKIENAKPSKQLNKTSDEDEEEQPKGISKVFGGKDILNPNQQ